MLFSNNRSLLDSLLWGSTVFYSSDGLASCCNLVQLSTTASKTGSN